MPVWCCGHCLVQRRGGEETTAMSRIVISTQTNPYLNIAVENYLLSQPSDGEVAMYLWRNRCTVVIGQNQNPWAECDVERLEADGGYLMRRRTGGGAVYHDLGNLNFSFIVPYECYDLTRQFGVLQRAVASYGLTTEVSGRNDVLCCGRKFSGNAFAKSKYQRLHHGTILIRTDVEELQRYLKPKPAKLQKHGVASVQSRVVNLSELVPELTAENLIPRMVEAFEWEYGSSVERLDFEALTVQPGVQKLYAEFADPEWKYGRWRQFVAQRAAQFAWGGVEMSVTVDEAAGRMEEVLIASDSLFPDAIALAIRLLHGASIYTPPVVNAVDEQTRRILDDIFALLYSVDDK